MGLDMYFTKDTFVSKYGEDFDKLVIKFKGVKQDRVQTIVEEVGYLRKANQIHGWLIEHIQDDEDNCAKYYFDDINIQILLDTIMEVLNDHSKAKELLPVMGGFFFGNYDEEDGYDEGYFEQLEEAKEFLICMLEEDGSYYYQSSW